MLKETDNIKCVRGAIWMQQLDKLKITKGALTISNYSDANIYNLGQRNQIKPKASTEEFKWKVLMENEIKLNMVTEIIVF